VSDEYEEFDATFWLVIALFITQLLVALLFYAFFSRKFRALMSLVRVSPHI
jgi:hypothetical protein